MGSPTLRDDMESPTLRDDMVSPTDGMTEQEEEKWKNGIGCS